MVEDQEGLDFIPIRSRSLESPGVRAKVKPAHQVLQDLAAAAANAKASALLNHGSNMFFCGVERAGLSSQSPHGLEHFCSDPGDFPATFSAPVCDNSLVLSALGVSFPGWGLKGCERSLATQSKS